MNIVNEDVITKILSANEPNAKITVLKWDVNNNIIKAGNNYMSEVSRLTVDYEKDGISLKRHVFLKVPFNSPMYDMGCKYDLFLKELTMYTEILPQFYAIDDECFTARNYYVDDKQSLFLKDLSQSGYTVANRTEQLDFDHCSYALKCLAKYHGLSVKLEKTRGFRDIIRKDAFYNEQNRDENMKSSFLSGLQKFYDVLAPEIQQKYAKEIDFFKSTNWDDLINDINPSDNFNVLNHGDFWTNNIMFKYDKYGIIKKVKLLDFQLCRWASPAVDLLYFAITSMKYEVFDKHFDLLLDIYLNTLNKVLKTLDCQTYAKEDLKKEMEKRYKYGIGILTCMLPIIVSDPDNPIDLNEVVKENEFNMTLMHKTLEQTHYIGIATKWFLYFAQKIREGAVHTDVNGSLNGKISDNVI